MKEIAFGPANIPSVFFRIGQCSFRHLARFDPRRTEQKDGVADIVILEPLHRLQILGQQTQGAGIGPIHKIPVVIGLFAVLIL